jgi:hypothetical protein
LGAGGSYIKYGCAGVQHACCCPACQQERHELGATQAFSTAAAVRGVAWSAWKPHAERDGARVRPVAACRAWVYPEPYGPAAFTARWIDRALRARSCTACSIGQASVALLIRSRVSGLGRACLPASGFTTGNTRDHAIPRGNQLSGTPGCMTDIIGNHGLVFQPRDSRQRHLLPSPPIPKHRKNLR